MTEKVNLDGSGSAAVALGVVVGQGSERETHLKGLSYSTLNQLSGKLSCGFIWVVVVEISGNR